MSKADRTWVIKTNVEPEVVAAVWSQLLFHPRFLTLNLREHILRGFRFEAVKLPGDPQAIAGEVYHAGGRAVTAASLEHNRCSTAKS